MLYNKKMLNILKRNNYFTVEDFSLVNVKDDSLIEKNECVLSEQSYSVNRHISPHSFSDKTGYECFINSFHVEDYVSENCISAAYWYLQNLFAHWNRSCANKVLVGIISNDSDSTVLRFHLYRKGEYFLDENLDAYKFEAILQLYSQ